MGVTSQGIEFPDDSDPIKDLQDHLQAMAESVDAAISPRAYTAGELGVTTGANWSIVQFTAVKIGVLRVVQLQISYSGSTITADSKGDIPNQSVLTNFPADWQPSFSTSFAYDAGATGGFGTFGTTFSLRTAMPTSTITSGTTVTIGCPYVALS